MGWTGLGIPPHTLNHRSIPGIGLSSAFYLHSSPSPLYLLHLFQGNEPQSHVALGLVRPHQKQRLLGGVGASVLPTEH